MNSAAVAKEPKTKLFSPYRIKDILFKNRLAVSPMCEYSSENGYANDWHLVHLGSRAVGGAALVIQEATAVCAEGRISPGDLGLYETGHVDKLRQITSFIKSQGAVPGIQLAHAGRKASHAVPWHGGKALSPNEQAWPTVAPSAIPFVDSDPLPTELTEAAIETIIAQFSVSAALALDAGYQLIEIHGAHGYLVHEFISPLSNHRTDQYGGSFENRCRFLLRIVSAVQKVWPASLPLWVRISATDWAEGGCTIDDSLALAKLLREAGVDLIDCSSGGLVHHQHIVAGPGYQVPFAARIKREVGIATGAVGLITTAEQAELILEKGEADMILLAREMLRDPYFPLHAAHALEEEVQWPVQYDRAKLKIHH